LIVEVNLRRPPDAVYAGVQVKPDGVQKREKRFDWPLPGTSISDAPSRGLWRKDFSRKSIGTRVCSCQGTGISSTSSTFDWTRDSRGTEEFQHNIESDRRSRPVRILCGGTFASMPHRRNRAHPALRARRLNAVFFRLHDRSDQSAVLLGSDDGNCGARFQQTRICGHIISYGYIGADLNRLLPALVGHR
jgi:hypothetical protein